MSEANENIIEELVRALQAEKYAKEFFEWAKSISTNDGTKEIFSFFAQEEESHIRLINKQLAKKAGEEWKIEDLRPEKFPGLDIPSKEELMEKDISEKEAIDIAIKIEESAIKFYKELLSLSVDEEDKKFYSDFITFEQGHYDQFKKKYEEMS
ncbi:MAG: hypothetical protein D6734_08135 [Candidatus Schekmanbacteria bacterium]|nr:MAG: hypothetical protein D6734_08135 [Candidatus Schekmanbacteria bacterium]